MRVHEFVLNRKYSYQNHSQLQIQNAHVVSYFCLKDKEEESSHMGKKKRFVPKEFESMKGVHDTSANIYRSMLLHQVCKDLTTRQFRLYVYCKSEFYGKNRHDLDGFPDYTRENSAYFTFNRAKWHKDGLYGLYSNYRQFYRDMAAQMTESNNWLFHFCHKKRVILITELDQVTGISVDCLLQVRYNNPAGKDQTGHADRWMHIYCQ